MISDNIIQKFKDTQERSRFKKKSYKDTWKRSNDIFIQTTNFKDTLKRPNNFCCNRIEYIKTLGKELL